MIGVVDDKRAELGAVQNRLDSTIRNQSNISENVSAAVPASATRTSPPKPPI